MPPRPPRATPINSHNNSWVTVTVKKPVMDGTTKKMSPHTRITTRPPEQKAAVRLCFNLLLILSSIM